MRLWDEFIPYCRRTILIYCAETCDAVIFEGLNGPFSGISPVVMGLDELDFDVLLLQKFLYRLAGDIVYNVKDGFESPLGEVRDVVLESLNDGCLLCVCHWRR